ncbi:DNA-binding protein RHL1-like isoform X1 [Zingiber officinale]|uniref:DNA-binding protein RHL1-like isoform X1 n=1 Tax=Zingiber officinale TaxID=94328 RepID=UPI001C4CB27A|nr:DNA-binding protein RHL1-like isoform X1 [Zingiber officinale]
MAKRKKGIADDDEGRPADPETEEKRRLRSLAFSRKLLRRTSLQPSAPLEPSKAVVRLQGRDIVKRGQRKSRYLFSFPGLLAPLSSGRIGELTDLGSKNPILYLEFPQGRMKLFGTHVYPKNKYLTLQLTKSSKGVMCEDVFESMIVFSDAWWIGRKEENPQELQLELPKCISESDKVPIDYDFKGGAGSPAEEQLGGNTPANNKREPLSPKTESEDTLPDDSDNMMEQGTKNASEATPVRQSTRNAGKKRSYAESSEDDSAYNDVDVPEIIDEKMEKSCPIDFGDVASTSELVDRKVCSTEKVKKAASSKGPKGNAINKKGTLVQATLSNLFEKVADEKPKRNSNASPGSKGPGSGRPTSASKKSTEKDKAKGADKKEAKSGGKKRGKQNSSLQVPVEPEDISSDSKVNHRIVALSSLFF